MKDATQKFLNSVLTILFTCMLVMHGKGVSADESPHYKFGVFPFMPMAALIKYYNSVSQDLTRKIRKRVIAQSRPTYKLFSDEIENETYDIIFIQPFDYPKAYDHGYLPIARRVDNLDAILVSRIDSNIQSIKDLAGKRLANPPQESAISIVTHKELKKAGLDKEGDVEMIYTGNHFACMQMVLLGKAEACSTTSPVLERWETSQLKMKKLHIIHRAKGVPHTLYMAHKRVPEKDRLALKQAITTWDKRPEGKMILKTFTTRGFVEANDADYDVIRNY